MINQTSNKYLIEFTGHFTKNYLKLTRNDVELRLRIRKTVNQLTIDPFHPGIKTHLANTKLFNKKFSSRVNGDIRIIWEFKDSKTIILLLTIDSHKVYK